MALKDFIDKTTPAFVSILDNAIVGVRTSVKEHNVDGNYAYELVNSLTNTMLRRIAAFNENTGLFESVASISTSGNISEINIQLFDTTYRENYNNNDTALCTRIILFKYDLMWTWAESSMWSSIGDDLIRIFGKDAIIYYKDLK